VHRPGERDLGEVGLGLPEEPRRVVAHVECGVGVLGQGGPLGRRQGRVEDDGDDAGAQRAEYDGQQRRGSGRGDQHAVPGDQPGGGEGGGGPPLVAFATGGVDDRDVAHASRTGSDASGSMPPSTRPSARSLSRVARVDCAAAGHSCRGTSA
jgi:hypothetical protein